MNTEFEKSFLENNDIIVKREIPYISISLFAASIILFAVGLGMGNENGAKMPTLMIAAIIAAIGIIKLFVTTKSLIYRPTKEPLTKRELFFEQSMRESVVGMVERGETGTLVAKDRRSHNLPIKVTMYATASYSIAICRAYNFVPYTFEAITEYKVTKK